MEALKSSTGSFPAGPPTLHMTLPCATCHKPETVNKLAGFKNCSPCREKNQQKKVLAQERKKQRDEAYRMYMKQVADSRTEVKENTPNVQVAAVTSTGATKRKSPKALHELEGEEQRAALGLMKNGLKQMVKGNKRVVSAASLRIVDTSGEGKEYQSASAMYDAVKKKLKKASPGDAPSSKFLKFRGFHSIVAVSTIDNQKRVDMVAKDLRKIVRVSFERSTPTRSHNFETMAPTLSFKCTCLGHEPSGVPTSSVPTTAAATATLKGTQGDLIRQARARNAAEALASRVPRVCGGTIKITSVDDGRHPLGILGQRISISIEHPSRSSKSK